MKNRFYRQLLIFFNLLVISDFCQVSDNSYRKIIKSLELRAIFHYSIIEDPFFVGCRANWRNIVYSHKLTYSYCSINAASFFWTQFDNMAPFKYGEYYRQNNKHLKTDSVFNV